MRPASTQRGGGEGERGEGAPLTAIPFVLIPGDGHYMAIDVPTEAKNRGGALVDIELVQEEAVWWGKPLRVRL
jgi:hypothetical protein